MSFAPPPPPIPFVANYYPASMASYPTPQTYVAAPPFFPPVDGHQHYFFAATPPPLQLRSITAANINAEMQMIGGLMLQFPYISIDVEYAGVVHHPAVAARNLTADERYALVKANVDEVPIVQLGITLSDSNGNLPLGFHHAGPRHLRQLVWEVVFSDFDASRGEAHAANSVKFLESQGVDFDLARLTGVSSTVFGERLLAILPPRPDELTWSAFGAAYDMAYMLKMLTGGQPLPDNRTDFLLQIQSRLRGGRIFDTKCIVDYNHHALRDLGLKQTASRLGVGQQMMPMLAGYKSFLASRIFTICRLPRVDNNNYHQGHIDGLV
uniref:poly(A)-specific ribonuclease n=1 Tax=Leersia perrieri TaxID=77586 RepID=A0A0D9XHG0_9ORYZ